MTACARGCTTARRHASDCDDRDCPGCRPRTAEYGQLCYPCHKRLLDMLATAPGQASLLATNKGDTLAHPLRDDHDRRGDSDDGAPTPYNLAVHDALGALRDVLNAWVDMLCQDYRLSGPEGHSVAETATWLTAQHQRLEACDGIGDLWTELAEIMAHAHNLAPWREQVSRLHGIPCPACHRCSLAIFGGDEDVTCLSCREMIPPGRYAIWTKMLAAEHQDREATA